MSSPITAPVSRWRLIHLLAIAAVHFCSVGFLMQFPRYVIGIGGSAQDAGWILSLGLIPALVLAPRVSEWNRRAGGRWPAVCGGLITAGANLAMIFIHQVDLAMYALRLLYTVGQTILFVTLFSQAAALGHDPGQRARMIGWLALMMQIGNAFGGAVGEYAYLQGGQVFWSGCAAFALLAAVLSAGWSCPAAAAGVVAPTLPHAAPARWPGEVWAMVAVGMAFAGLTQFVPAFIAHIIAIGQVASPFAAAWFVTPALLTVALVRMIAGYFAARLLGRWTLRACHALLLLTILVLPWIEAREHAVLLSLAFGLGYGWLYPALSSLAYSHAAPSAAGRVGGWLVTAFEVGFRLSAAGLGILITHAGWQAMFAGLALAYGALLLIAGWTGSRNAASPTQ